MVIIVIMALFMSLSQVLYAGPSVNRVPEVAFLFHEKGRLVFAEKLVDFGRIKKGITVSHEIHYKNESEVPVKVTAKLIGDLLSIDGFADNKTLAPGEEGKFKISLNSSRGSGTVVNSFIVTSDEKILSSYVFTVKAQIDEKILIFPTVVMLTAEQSQQIKGTVLLASLDKTVALGIPKLEYDQSVLDVAQHPTQDDYVIEVSMKPDTKLSSYEGSIKVIAGEKGDQTMVIPVLMQPGNKIMLQPTSVDFGTLAAAEKKGRDLRVKGAASIKDVMLRADLFIDGVQVDQATAETLLMFKRATVDGKDRIFKVEILHNGSKSGRVHGRFVVMSSEAGWHEPVIDFYALFEQKQH